MKQDYSDITDRLGKPLYWDVYGTPRYGNPDNIEQRFFTTVYCQACGESFHVATVESVYSQPDKPGWLSKDDPRYKEICVGAYYGDPPRHDCPAGNTMTVDTEEEHQEFWGGDDPNDDSI